MHISEVKKDAEVIGGEKNRGCGGSRSLGSPASQRRGRQGRPFPPLEISPSLTLSGLKHRAAGLAAPRLRGAPRTPTCERRDVGRREGTVCVACVSPARPSRWLTAALSFSRRAAQCVLLRPRPGGLRRDCRGHLLCARGSAGSAVLPDEGEAQPRSRGPARLWGLAVPLGPPKPQLLQRNRKQFCSDAMRGQPHRSPLLLSIDRRPVI